MEDDVSTGEWSIKDLESNKDWLLHLSLDDQEEIILATKYSLSSGKTIYDLTSKDFPLNKFFFDCG